MNNLLINSPWAILTAGILILMMALLILSPCSTNQVNFTDRRRTRARVFRRNLKKKDRHFFVLLLFFSSVLFWRSITIRLSKIKNKNDSTIYTFFFFTKLLHRSSPFFPGSDVGKNFVNWPATAWSIFRAVSGWLVGTWYRVVPSNPPHSGTIPNVTMSNY